MKIPVILGTTATGKTALGIELAKLINGEVISVDSRKVYRGLPVGTATPPGTWNKNQYFVDGIPHHLMGHISPDAPYTAGDFLKDAEKLITEICARKKIPILVGGTGFYFKALKEGLPQLPTRNEPFRKQCDERIKSEGHDAVFNELKEIDPIAAQNIASNDTHKIIRALEIIEITGQPYSSWKDKKMNASQYQFSVMGLHMDKSRVDKKIEVRSKKMVQNGMIEETKQTLAQGFSKSCPALMSFGYREAVQVVEGTMTADEFCAQLIHKTKAYAKRQRTYFRTQIIPHWFEQTPQTPLREISLKMKDFLDIIT